MEDERTPLASVGPEGEVAVRGEYGSKEAQEGEGSVSRRRGRSLCVGRGSEALDPIRGGGRGKPLRLRPDIRRGGVRGR